MHTQENEPDTVAAWETGARPAREVRPLIDYLRIGIGIVLLPGDTRVG